MKGCEEAGVGVNKKQSCCVTGEYVAGSVVKKQKYEG